MKTAVRNLSRVCLAVIFTLSLAVPGAIFVSAGLPAGSVIGNVSGQLTDLTSTSWTMFAGVDGMYSGVTYTAADNIAVARGDGSISYSHTGIPSYASANGFTLTRLDELNASSLPTGAVINKVSYTMHTYMPCVGIPVGYGLEDRSTVKLIALWPSKNNTTGEWTAAAYHLRYATRNALTTHQPPSLPKVTDNTGWGMGNQGWGMSYNFGTNPYADFHVEISYWSATSGTIEVTWSGNNGPIGISFDFTCAAPMVGTSAFGLTNTAYTYSDFCVDYSVPTDYTTEADAFLAAEPIQAVADIQDGTLAVTEANAQTVLNRIAPAEAYFNALTNESFKTALVKGGYYKLDTVRQKAEVYTSGKFTEDFSDSAAAASWLTGTTRAPYISMENGAAKLVGNNGQIKTPSYGTKAIQSMTVHYTMGGNLSGFWSDTGVLTVTSDKAQDVFYLYSSPLHLVGDTVKASLYWKVPGSGRINIVDGKLAGSSEWHEDGAVVVGTDFDPATCTYTPVDIAVNLSFYNRTENSGTVIYSMKFTVTAGEFTYTSTIAQNSVQCPASLTLKSMARNRDINTLNPVSEISSLETVWFDEIAAPQMKGASIKKTDDLNEQDLRFETRVDVSRTPTGYTPVSYGTLIMPLASMNDSTYDALTRGYVGKSGLAVLEGKADVSSFIDVPDVFYANIGNSADAEIRASRFAARSFIVWRNNSTSEEYTVYSGNEITGKVTGGQSQRSVMGVSKAIYNAIHGSVTDPAALTERNQVDAMLADPSYALPGSETPLTQAERNRKLLKFICDNQSLVSALVG